MSFLAHWEARKDEEGPVVIPASPDLVRALYPGGLGRTAWAYAVLLKGQPVGIAGLSYDGRQMVAFSKISDELRPYRKFIVQQARYFMEWAEAYRVIVAVADPEESGAPRFLEWLGFALAGENLEGSRIYTWHRPQS